MRVPWTRACRYADLVDGRAVGILLAGIDVCLVRVRGEVFAVHDECTHEAVPLSDGDVEDGEIECWRHGSRFDLRTGGGPQPACGEAHRRVRGAGLWDSCRG